MTEYELIKELAQRVKPNKMLYNHMWFKIELPEKEANRLMEQVFANDSSRGGKTPTPRDLEQRTFSYILPGVIVQIIKKKQ